MFKKTSSEVQLSLFTSPEQIMSSTALKMYNDPHSWHNMFYENVTKTINEDVFRPLFSETMGTPSKSLRIIVAMIVIKEGLGISDEMLYNECNFNLLFRRALGIRNLDDDIVCLATYYNFRRKVLAYDAKMGTDLMKDCMSENTQHYLTKFDISGAVIRMDSKLISSNIAWFGRYVLVHKILCREIDKYLSSLNPSLIDQVNEIKELDAEKECYVNNKETISQKFANLGLLIKKILTEANVGEDDLLRRVFNEQFTCSHGIAVAKDNKDIPADSIQSPYDTDATYRKKGEQEVKGFSVNVAETVEENKPNIITAVQVMPATAADNQYLQDAVTDTEEITGNNVTNIYADGAYQSEPNRQFCEANGTTLTTCGIQGRPGRYQYEFDDKKNELHVTDTTTGETYVAVKAKKNWKFIDSNGELHRVTQKEIDSYQLRKKINATPASELNIRNNIEAAMFQISFHTRNNKTRYRGLGKHKLLFYARSMWMNFRRALIFELKEQATTNQRTLAIC